MPVAVINNQLTQDDYAESLTEVFQFPRSKFSIQIYNAGIGYKLLYSIQGQAGAFQEEASEHFMGPSYATFSEGDRPSGVLFAGIKFRSWVTGTPARVTVI